MEANPNWQLLFEKWLSTTDTQHTLALPVAHRDVVWPPNQPFKNHKTFQVVDQRGHTWDLVAHLRWDKRGNPKPEVYGTGWRRFVADKELKPKDKLLFYRNPDLGRGNEIPRFLVTVRKHTGNFRLFGEPIHTFAEED